uniref:Uncharacterized protein KIAA2012 homolog isoform X1 n=1 Tax=Petromyzon marinus TaxID=7757 RepID=A0AAJ7TAH7_PETMA|nr:uncharacterized protein KIAA2012 homolog isoform X1 [Petromyzon marinus]XP_032813123.1 uncharacterized protein KIAA2012 homolog isoform X1 [Petromyzon marinus]XP_032813124.1 uncharacterized protein KIAA2012 homolog isoform X1 [Petromyzon marinus]
MLASDRGMPLSLLSRGIGLLVRNGQEKVEVYFEPQDYLNWRVTGGRHPVCRCPYWPTGGLAKTYTTRKGPLLLYSEELAYPAHLYQEEVRRHQRRGHQPSLPQPESFLQQVQPHQQEHLNQQALLFQQTQLNHKAHLQQRARAARRRPEHPDRNADAVTAQLKTLSDLTDAILIYGCRQIVGGQHCPSIQSLPSAKASRIRPGYSARRYLCNWFHSWDEALLLKLHNSGRISYSTLYREGRWSPRAFRRAHYDLTAAPQPYQLTSSMLQAPGPTLLCRTVASYASGDETEEKQQGSGKQMTLPDGGGASSYPDSGQCGVIGKCFDQPANGHQLEPSSQDCIVKETINKIDALKSSRLPPIGAHISPAVRERPPPLHRTLIDTSHLRSPEENRSFASFYGGSLAGNRRNVGISAKVVAVDKRDSGHGEEDRGMSRFPALTETISKEPARKPPPSDGVKLPLITMEPPATPQKQQAGDNTEGEAEQRKGPPQPLLPSISQGRPPTWGLIKQGATRGGVTPFEAARAKPATGGARHGQVARDAGTNRMARADQGAATFVKPQRDRSPDRGATKAQVSVPPGDEPVCAAKERDGVPGVHWGDAVVASSSGQPVRRATDMEGPSVVGQMAAGESSQYEWQLLGKKGPGSHDSATSNKGGKGAKDMGIKGDKAGRDIFINPEDIEVAETVDVDLEFPPVATGVDVGAGEVSGAKAERGGAKPGGATAALGAAGARAGGGSMKPGDAAEGSGVKAGACSITFEGGTEGVGSNSSNKLNGGVTKGVPKAAGSSVKAAGGEGTTVVKGNLPEELRATHTGKDFMGSAVLGPDGEIIKLSLVRAAYYIETKGQDGAGDVLVFNVSVEQSAAADERQWNALMGTSQRIGDEDVRSVESGVMEDEDYQDLPVSNKQRSRDIDTEKDTETEKGTTAFSAVSQGAADSGLFVTSPVTMSALTEPGTVMALPPASESRVEAEFEAWSRELNSSLSPNETVIVEDGRTGQRIVRSRQTPTQMGPPSRSKTSVSIILPSQGMDDPESFRSDEDSSSVLSNAFKDSKEQHSNKNVSETSQNRERSAQETGKNKAVVSKKGKRPEARGDKDTRSAKRSVETRERASVREGSTGGMSHTVERRTSSNDPDDAWEDSVGDNAEAPSRAETRIAKETKTKKSEGSTKAKANENERNAFVVGKPRKTRMSEATQKGADGEKAPPSSKKESGDEQRRKKPSRRSAGPPEKGGSRGTDDQDSGRDDNSAFQDDATGRHRRGRRGSQVRAHKLGSQTSEGQLVEPGKEPGSDGQSPALSEREARRAAQSEQRRLEVERRRQESESQRLQELEQQDREEVMRAELEEARLRREEEARQKKRQQELERLKVQELEMKRMERERAERERERRQQEEHRRRVLEIQRRKQEEEALKKAEQERLEREEAERRAEEERMLAQMDESERLEYEQRRREEEEQRRLAEEQRRRVMEEEARLAMEEAMRQARFLAKQQAELERHLMFHRELWLETSGMEQTQDVSRPWVYSYYELLQMLGLQRPELEAGQHVD